VLFATNPIALECDRGEITFGLPGNRVTMTTARVWFLGLGLATLAAACSSPQTVGSSGTGGTPGSGTGGIVGTTCSGTLTACGTNCVDTSSDVNNCGVCGNPCSGGQTCQDSVCKCPSGMLNCGGSCVASDATHCGSCATTCTTGQVCSNNSCSSSCASGQTMCGTACVDTTSDAANCGSCGHACTATQNCTSSACVDNVTTGTGGSTGTGGGVSTGGTTGSGGMAGKAGNTGGSTGTGGAATGGSPGTGGTAVTMKVITSGPGAYWTTATATTVTSGTVNVTVNDTSPAQKWDGFGGAFNELGWTYLTSSAMQTQAVTLLFSSTAGANFAWGRIPMGASDYATSRYTDDDTGADPTPNSSGSTRPAADTSMSMFSLSRDGTNLIPYIQAAQGVNPNLRFWSSPWTPPLWMKTGYKTDNGSGGTAKKPSYYDGGSIVTGNSSYLTAYATYYANFVKGYKAKGINIEIVSPQNEPGYEQNYPSCLWDKTTYVSWVKTLGAAMQPLNVKIMLGTMSNNGDTVEGVVRHDTDIATAVLADSTAAGYVTVAGAQWGVLDAVNTGTKFGSLPIWATEHKCGNYPWITSTQAATTNPPVPAIAAYNSTQAPNDQAYGVESWSYIRNAIKSGGVTAYNAWNMVLDKIGLGIDTSRDWRQDALLVASGGTVTPTPAYYVFRHCSQYVQPGANVVTTTGGDAIAFKNADGSVVVAMYNSGSASTYIVQIKGQKLSFPMPATGWATVVVP